MFFSKLKQGFLLYIDPISLWFISNRFHPNTFTFVGLGFSTGAAVLFWGGWWFSGGLALLAAGICDILDGQIARQTKSLSKFGGLLDSTVDRIAEILVFLGILLLYIRIGWTVSAAMVFMAASGSVMVSYVRARAEGLGFDCRVGIMQRAERVIFLVAASFFGTMAGTPEKHVAVAMWIIAIFTFYTTFQRVLYIRRIARMEAPAPPS